MSRHHFFASPDDITADRVTLTGDEAHHAARVLRLHPGERITVADGSGRVVDAVVRVLGEIVEAEIEDVRTVQAARPAIRIHQALMKGDRMDDMIEKSVEIGVARIAPFEAERSIVRWDDRKRQKAQERWTNVALAAAKQCRSPWLTTIEPVSAGVPAHADLVLHEEATLRFRDTLPDEPPASIDVVVGPEGGLTPDEVERIDAAAVSLGPRILRTEVAGPVAAAIIAYRYGSLG
jgi:16S rRNA (uracil1498-N3)-methyltransferase